MAYPRFAVYLAQLNAANDSFVREAMEGLLRAAIAKGVEFDNHAEGMVWADCLKG